MNMTPDELDRQAEHWVVALRAEGKAPNTIRSYDTAVRQMAAFMRARGEADLSLHSAREFIASIRDDGGSASTASVRARALRGFSAWLDAEGLTTGNLLARLKTPKPAVNNVPDLNEDEMEALLTCAVKKQGLLARRDEAIIRFMSQAGARADETLHMDIGDLDLSARNAVLRKTKGARKPRKVHLSPETAEAITQYLMLRSDRQLAGDAPLWLSKWGDRLTYDSLRARQRQIAIEAGVKGFHTHRLRHTASVEWLVRGGSEGGLMSNNGWSSRDMIDKYVEKARERMTLRESKRIYG